MNADQAVTPKMSASLLSAQRSALVVLGMFVGLAIFYRGSYQLPVSAAGLALFAALALWRPELGLLFVPLSVPLYFMPKGIWDERFGIRPEGVRFPLHEVVLLIVLAGAALHLALRLARGWRPWAGSARPDLRALAAWLAPVALFLLAASVGVAIVPPEGRGAALREWRWLIVEPLLFAGLVVGMQHAGCKMQNGAGSSFAFCILHFYLLGGALVGLVGLLQFFGLNLAPLIGDKVGFSDDRIFVEGVQRVASVYGHPNNLGLYMGRIWPVAAALAVLCWRQNREQRAGNREQRTGNREQRTGNRPWTLFFVLCSLFSLGGLLVSFSRGAYLGALAAALVLAAALWATTRARRWRLIGFAAGVAAVALGLGLAALAAGVERFNLLGVSSSIRVKTWLSALAMIRDHPLLGVGLDQFGRLYPQYIDPSLRGTNEVNTAHPHNLVLDIWLRMGLPGLLAFGWLVARFFRSLQLSGPGAARTAPSAVAHLHIGLAAAMVAALVHGLVDSFYFWPDLAFAFWLMLALGRGGSEGQSR